MQQGDIGSRALQCSGVTGILVEEEHVWLWTVVFVVLHSFCTVPSLCYEEENRIGQFMLN